VIPDCKADQDVWRKMEQHVIFKSKEIFLEGLLNSGESEHGVVIMHPHPLYGGDMHNPVVSAISSAAWERGFATLKFNFRGVGKSNGDYDNGKGEKDDLLGAVAFLSESGVSRIDLVGYSFGAWVASQLEFIPTSVENIILVSPPAGMMTFSHTPAIDRVTAIITGSRDEIAPASEIRRLFKNMNSKAKIKIITDADHFYGNDLESLKSSLISLL
jgi:uncharacterized protein